MKRRRKWVFRVLTCLLSLFVAAVLGEIALRIYVRARGWTPDCYASDLQLFEPHPQRGSDLRPGATIRTGVTRITINSRGFRGPEITKERPAGTSRIVISGGSSVFGYFVSDDDEAARILETKLRERGRRVEVLNDGVPGYNLFHLIDRFEERVAPLEPNIVMLYAGWNDLTYLCSNDPAAARYTQRADFQGVERALGQSTLYCFVTRRVLGGQVRLAPTNVRSAVVTAAGEQQFRENLNRLADAVEQRGCRLVICAPCTAARPEATPGLRELLGSKPEVFERMTGVWQKAKQILADVAEARRATYFDAQAALPADEATLRDYVHLTADGERRLAEFWTEQLDPLLPPGS